MHAYSTMKNTESFITTYKDVDSSSVDVVGGGTAGHGDTETGTE